MINWKLRMAACVLVATLAACAKPEPGASVPLAVAVSEDALTCTVTDKPISCQDLVSHLETLQTPTSRLIILSDRKKARADDAVTKLADGLRDAGYRKVVVAGYMSERL